MRVVSASAAVGTTAPGLSQAQRDQMASGVAARLPNHPVVVVPDAREFPADVLASADALARP